MFVSTFRQPIGTPITKNCGTFITTFLRLTAGVAGPSCGEVTKCAWGDVGKRVLQKGGGVFTPPLLTCIAGRCCIAERRTAHLLGEEASVLRPIILLQQIVGRPGNYFARFRLLDMHCSAREFGNLKGPACLGLEPPPHFFGVLRLLPEHEVANA